MKMALVSVLWMGLASLLCGAERVALVIGNNAYAHGSVLVNPVNDAKAVKTALEGVGFEVMMVTDASHQAMEKAVVDFRKKAQGAEAALFYYAGHGLEVGGRNYLVPIDAKVEEEYEVKHKTLALDAVLGAMKTANARVRVVALDCCRDNPLGRSWQRSGAAGLKAPEQVPNGTLLVFAAAPGQVASDGAGQNSPFTTAFVRHVGEAGLEVEQVFKKVGQSVAVQTGQKQRPWMNSSFYGRFVFHEGKSPEPSLAPKVKKGSYAGEKWELKLPGGVPMMMRWIPPTGSEGYWMGSPEDEPGRESNETRHRVVLTEGYWLGETEVTQGQWEAVMGRSQHEQVDLMLADEVEYQIGEKKQTMRKHYEGLLGEGYEKTLKNFAGGRDYPVWCVNWEEAVEFGRLVQLGSGGQLGALKAGLPSEAQWEWACRSGSREATYVGNLVIEEKYHAPVLDGIAWYGGNSSEGYPEGQGVNANWAEKQYPGGRAGPREVGKKQGNRWGLRDMIGNVWEWTGDWYGAYPEGLVTDPEGPSAGTSRVFRGGGWGSSAARCRSAYRGRFTPSFRYSNLGFRVVLQSQEPVSK